MVQFSEPVWRGIRNGEMPVGPRTTINQFLTAKRARVMRLISICVLVGCGSAATQSEGAPQASSEGKSPPIAFEFTDMAGKAWRSVDRRGKPLVVTVFTSWCQPCLSILEQLDATRTIPEYAEKFDVVAVSVDQNLGPVLTAFLEQLDVKYAVVQADEKTRFGHGPFGRIAAVPTTYLLDSEGRLIETLVGGVPIDHLVRQAVAQEGAKQ